MDVNDIKRKLKSEDENERIFALQDVLIENISDLVPEVVKLVENDSSQIVKETAVDVLKNINIANYYEYISKMFESTDAYVRNAAIEIFGAKGEEVVPYLTSIMDHKNKEIRKLILDSLVATGSEYAYPALEAALNDHASNVKITAVEYIGTLQHTNAKNKILDIFLKAEEPMLKIACLETLTNIGDKETVNSVLNYFDLNEGKIDNFYKPFIFKMIGYHGDCTHIDNLLNYLNYKNLSFIREILGALNKLIKRCKILSIPKEAISFLKKIINSNDSDIETKVEIVNILSSLQFDNKEKFFEDLCDNKDKELVMIAFDVLFSLNKEKAIKLLNKKIKVSTSDEKEVLLNIKEELMGEKK
ncbi:HEAT repeat domain-containing protein [Deferribacter abyssi]|uniref:HEAT repeat domain-containing protein n=1 Tax=Deferribacter abyssi TaxID=213806 RepID=UPI003C1E1B01